MRFSNMGSRSTPPAVVSWNYAYVSQLYVDIRIFRWFTFLKNLKCDSKIKKLFFILNLERYSQDDQGLSVFPQFRWSPPTHALNPSRPQSLRTPSTAVSLKPKKRGHTKESCIESAKKNIHKTRGFIEWPNSHFRFHRSLVC